MGGGSWTSSAHEKYEEELRGRGEEHFEYSRVAAESGDFKVHADLDPRKIKKVRESRDSKEHPNSRAIMVWFDETGSMQRNPELFVGKLPSLMGLLYRHNYVDDPQILFGAHGDVTSDEVPLQIGQFESDVRMEKNLDRFVLEGQGGPYGQESYELAIYAAARKTSIDCFEKRGEKGIMFLIGDEEPYPVVSRQAVKAVFGTTEQSDIPLAQILEEAKEKWMIFFIIPANASGSDNSTIQRAWSRLLGRQNVIKLSDSSLIAETIAATIGIVAKGVDSAEVGEHLRETKISLRDIDTVTKAVSVIPKGERTAVARSSGSLHGLDKTGRGGVHRL